MVSNPIKATALLVVAGALLSTYLYISHLQGKVKDLTASLQQEQVISQALRDTVISLTESKQQREARLKQVEARNQQLRQANQKLQDEVKVAPIPTECQPALDWLVEEIVK